MLALLYAIYVTLVTPKMDAEQEKNTPPATLTHS